MIKKHLITIAAAALLMAFAPTAFATDTDSDGLSDWAENNAYGTNPNDSNTDGDGWGDYAEIFTYGTDPTIADTDGDGDDDHVDTAPLEMQSGDPDGGSSPTFSGNPPGYQLPASGEYAEDGVGVVLSDGRQLYDLNVGMSKGVRMKFPFNIHYDNQSLYNGYFGFCWTSMLDIKLLSQPSGDQIYRDMNGFEWTFTWNGTDHDTPTGLTGTLEATGEGEFTYTTPFGMELQFSSENLEKVEDRFGNSLDLVWSGGQVTKITDSRGEDNTFTYYSGTGRVKQIDFADGRVWTFIYSTTAQLIRIEGPATTSFTNGIDLEFRYTNGLSDPDLNHNMIAAFDGLGQAWLKMTYDTADRVDTQTVGGTADYLFDYTNQGSQSVTVTDRAGNNRVWEWDSTKLTRTKLKQKSNRNVRTGDPTEWVTEWTHDTDGYLIEVEFPRGNGIEWTLNAAKLPTERRHKADVDASNSAGDLVHTWTYDSAKYYGKTAYTDPGGNETEYTLDSDGQPTTIDFPDSTHKTPTQEISHTYVYNADGTVQSFTDGEGTKTKYDYYTTPAAKKGRIEKVIVDEGTGKLNLTTEYDYTDWGQVKEVTDPEGNVTTYTVEAYGNVTLIDYPSALGYETVFEHDENLNVVTKKVKNIDEAGTAQTTPTHWVTEYEYTMMDKLSLVDEYTGATTFRSTTLLYDVNDNVEKWERDGVIVETTYDERDLAYQRKRDPGTTPKVNAIETYTYDANGNVSEYADPRDKDTTFEYDLFDRRTKVTNALGHYQDTIYDDNGNVTERKWFEDKTHPTADVLMAYQKRHYDELNRFYKEEDALIDTTTTWKNRVAELDKRGLVTSWTDRRSKETTFTYDAAGRRTEREDEIGNKVAWVYDDNGNTTKVTETEKIPGSGSTEAFVTDFTYDEINRRTKQEIVDRTLSTNKKTTEWKLNSRNVVAEIVDPMGYETTFTHDGLGRMTESSRDLGSGAAIVTKWAYDDNDNVRQIEDDNGKQTDYEYDALNRLVTKTYEDTETVTLTYDKSGNTTTIVDQIGNDIDQSFDDINRLTARDVTRATGVGGDDDESFEYDALNRLTEAQDDDSTVEFTFDSLGRMLTEKQGANPLGAEAQTVTYDYDDESNLTQLDYPSGFEAQRTYDDINRLTAIDDKNTNDIVDCDLYGAGGRRKTVSFGNSTTSNYTWDGFRRPTEIAHQDSSSLEFAGFEYGWDKNDNPLWEERSHQSDKGDTYGYDRANRLEQVLEDVDDPENESDNPGTEVYVDKVAWNLDDVHNFDSVVTTPYGGSASTFQFTNNAMNEYTDVGGTTHTYDANGNLSDDGTNTYEYDFHNHLIKVVKKSDSSTVAEYDYDAVGRGRRTEKVVGSDTTRFIYAGQQCIEELDGSDDLLRLFVFTDELDGVVMMEAEDVADVDDDANITELKRFFFHTQLIGSVTQVTDPEQNVVESYDYSPYGEIEIEDKNGGSVSGTQIGNPFTFTGRRLDEETGLYYYRARHYSAELGRFLQRDPLGMVDGPNEYAYVRGRPTAAGDPLGTFTIRFVGENSQPPDVLGGDFDEDVLRKLGLYPLPRAPRAPEKPGEGGDLPTKSGTSDAGGAGSGDDGPHFGFERSKSEVPSDDSSPAADTILKAAWALLAGQGTGWVEITIDSIDIVGEWTHSFNSKTEIFSFEGTATIWFKVSRRGWSGGMSTLDGDLDDMFHVDLPLSLSYEFPRRASVPGWHPDGGWTASIGADAALSTMWEDPSGPAVARPGFTRRQLW